MFFLRIFLTSFALLTTFSPCQGFLTPSPQAQTTSLFTTDRRMGELTSSEAKVFELLQTLHDSKHRFRVVVVGNGAILETTSVLGPVLAVSQSPKTGKNLITLASEAKDFEFHLQLADVAEISILEKETPAKTMRLIRILGGGGESMCSLILADPSDASVQWFHDIRMKYGESCKVA